jgi:BCD family chlorophyll transporter-like MFS transporter
MLKFGQKLTDLWVARGPRFLPFADVATPDLPLSRLLRLSLFQVTTGMALVLLVGTLNRVMIVELGVPASLVGIMLALPLVFAPFRALIGYKSDTHRCELGWRRVPFIWKGTLWQFGGFAIMPFALLVLAGEGEASTAPVWVGQSAAALSFLLVGAGVHTVQTTGLALATDLTPRESHARVVGLMYVMLLVGMMVSALLFGAALRDFTPGRLVQVIQGAALITIVLNAIAMWKQETRHSVKNRPDRAQDPTFRESWAEFCKGGDAYRRLVIIGIGTMAFGMADVLLEPFGGQVLAMSVAATTKLTALLALGGLLGFGWASRQVGRGADPYQISQHGAFIGVPAFALVIAAAPLGMISLFLVGNFLIGFGGALFAHGTLTATMNRAPKEQAGLALGAWGAVQATAVGVAMAMSGAIRDLVNVLWGTTEGLWGLPGVAMGYFTVYTLEITLLIITLIATLPLMRQIRLAGPGEDSPTPQEFEPAAELDAARGQQTT